MKIKFLLCAYLISTCAFSQDLVPVLDETVTVNSISAMSGSTRNTTEVTLPEKTKSYIYRISISPKGHSTTNNPLFEMLKAYGSANVSLLSSFAEFAIKNNDGEAVDAFIFNNVYDSQNFYEKNDWNWNACKSLMNRANCCFESKECINRKIYFGFRNNNMMQGLNVRIEVVAVIDNTMLVDYKNSFTIDNAAGKEIKFLISTDNINWKEEQLRNGYSQTYDIEEKELYIKIITDAERFVKYKVTPNDRYRIIWNKSDLKWDLFRY